MEIPFTRSPNYTPGGNSKTFIILHGSGGSEQGSETWISQPSSEVSYHYFIGKGDVTERDLRQFVNDDDQAWHVGHSLWEEHHALGTLSRWTKLNRHSIGIGLESMNEPDEVYTETQLALCVALCKALMTRYAIPTYRVLTHAMVSDPLGRKIDPVNFPYADVQRALNQRVVDNVQTLQPQEAWTGRRLFVGKGDLGSKDYVGRIARASLIGDKAYVRLEEES